eukprot:2902996-Rhodomonas_salina.1
MTIDGRDGGYTADLNEFTQEQHRLNLNSWDTKFPVIHQRLSFQHQGATKWDRLSKALKEYVTTAGEVLGWVINLKSPKPPFQLKGHKQLQQERQNLRAARKE